MKLNTYVISRLNVWASWRVRRESGALGYPSKCAFVKITNGNGFWTPEMDSNAYETEQCVLALPADLKQAIMQEFTITGTQAQKAQRCGWCLRTYQNKLNMAYSLVLGLMLDAAAGVPLRALKDSEKKVEAVA